jgi:urate oxidase
MKKLFLLFVLLVSIVLKAQEANNSWSFTASANFYFLSDDFIILPEFIADKNHIHLEARYNYEDLETASVWAGYNFYGGKKFTFEITPMAGVVFGLTNGIALGLEFEFTLGGFTFYNESEHLFDLKTEENNFFYSWADFTYEPLDWLNFGISGQRTQLFETESEIQHGLVLGSTFKNFDASIYLYNPEQDSRFLFLAFSYNF